MRVSKAILTMIVALSGATAAAAAPAASGPVPIGSPGDWLGTDDYPAAAVRFRMEGATAFRLTVDASGKAERCEITQSSGFDVLDKAACDRLMANARFTPAKAARGKPAGGVYASRVVWRLPGGALPPITEASSSLVMIIDPAGQILSCKEGAREPADHESLSEGSCYILQKSMPREIALELRGGAKGAAAIVELQSADAFTEAFRARALAPMAGYVQRGLYVHRFTVTPDGKLGSCVFEQQRGSDRFAGDFCTDALPRTFDPPFGALREGNDAKGWHILRVMAKVEE